MMQFTETLPVVPPPPPPPLHHHHHHHQIIATTMSNNNQQTGSGGGVLSQIQWPGLLPITTTTSKSFGNFGDANCMEQLLVHCANAIQTNDSTLAQQILWVLNNIAPPDGDSNQRLTCAFLRALVARAAKTGTCQLLAARYSSTYNNLVPIPTHRFSVVELASFIDLTPWHRFGFTAANSAILDSIEGYSSVHLVDLGSTHCMQIPTLIDAISSRFDPPPLVRLTVVAAAEEGTPATTLPPPPPVLDLSYEELGSKLVNFARSRNVAMEFRVVTSSYSDGFQSLIEHLRIQQILYSESSSASTAEALMINCHMMLHYIQDEATSSSLVSAREMFLKSIRSLEPTAVVMVEEDAELSGGNLVSRLRSAFNYFWIPFDAVEAFLPAGSRQRQWYEAEVCWRIENVIAQEGVQRVERGEGKSRWVQRMRNAAFKGVGFGEECLAEVRGMLGEHAAGWGLKREEDDQHLLLTWKGHNVAFATAWIPN